MLRSLLRFVGGAAVGAAVGAVVGLLITPASGEENKQNLLAFRDEIIEAGQQAEEERRAELLTRFSEAKRFKPAQTNGTSLL